MPPSPVPATASLVDRIDAILPQTQCRKCTFDGCRPYAEAIAANEADINQCPPGGDEGIRQLAALLGRTPKPLNPEHGSEKPKAVAVIDENTCIGCTLCIQACPVDAIVGAAKHMHTIVAPLCTGCELCLPPCPVNCIEMQPAGETPDAWGRSADEVKDAARERFELRKQRLAREKAEKAARLAARTAAPSTQAASPDASAAADRKKALIAAALERARQQREAAQPRNTTDVSPETQAKIDEIEARRAHGRGADKPSGGD